MKILDIPQSGKRGLNVSQASPFGQVSRTLAIPANPRSAAQSDLLGHRADLGLTIQPGRAGRWAIAPPWGLPAL